MNVRYFFQGVKPADETREYIDKKIQSVARMMKKVMNVEVEIEKQKRGNFRVEVMVKCPRVLYRSDNVSESIEAAIDLVEEELKNQVRSRKDKKATIRRRGARSIKKKLVIDENARF